MKRKLTISVLMLTIVLALITGCGKQDIDVFKNLYYAPPRDDILKEFGTPTETYESEGEVWEDVFENVEFMGETGKLYVYYRGRGYVTNAKYEVLFPSSDASNKQVANKYAEAVSNYYTKEYGEADDKGYWKVSTSDKLELYNLTDWNGYNFEVSISLNN